jgi:hypothetical protein
MNLAAVELGSFVTVPIGQSEWNILSCTPTEKYPANTLSQSVIMAFLALKNRAELFGKLIGCNLENL